MFQNQTTKRILLELLFFSSSSAMAVFCFRGNVEKKMLFYPKELHVSIN